jgi:hypothetical protein
LEGDRSLIEDEAKTPPPGEAAPVAAPQDPTIEPKKAQSVEAPGKQGASPRLKNAGAGPRNFETDDRLTHQNTPHHRLPTPQRTIHETKLSGAERAKSAIDPSAYRFSGSFGGCVYRGSVSASGYHIESKC